MTTRSPAARSCVWTRGASCGSHLPGQAPSAVRRDGRHAIRIAWPCSPSTSAGHARHASTSTRRRRAGQITWPALIGRRTRRSSPMSPPRFVASSRLERAEARTASAETWILASAFPHRSRETGDARSRGRAGNRCPGRAGCRRRCPNQDATHHAESLSEIQACLNFKAESECGPQNWMGLRFRLNSVRPGMGLTWRQGVG